MTENPDKTTSAQTLAESNIEKPKNSTSAILRRVLHANEFRLFLVLLGVSLLVQAHGEQFFIANNLLDLVNAMVVPGLFAIGVHVVLVSGGINVSFPALGPLAVYAVAHFMIDIDFHGPLLVVLLIITAVEALLGAFNDLFTSQLVAPTLIITLRTMNVFARVMQGALSAMQTSRLPEPINRFSRTVLLRVENVHQGTRSILPTALIFFVVVLVLIGFAMKYTMFGRALYTMGGSKQAAIRVGFRVEWVKFWLYVVIGVIAVVAGLMSVNATHQINPTDLLSMEVMVIAVVVLGGTAITGGKGSLLNVVMGIMLITIIQANITAAGIPTTDKRFVLDLMIIIGTGISTVQLARSWERQRLTTE